METSQSRPRLRSTSGPQGWPTEIQTRRTHSGPRESVRRTITAPATRTRFGRPGRARSSESCGSTGRSGPARVPLAGAATLKTVQSVVTLPTMKKHNY